ncbi:MAG TPA: hypothetical protein VKY73_18110 [Polyangiaceae bacterium]|nr:hypothetical protein [Polyangiaceae bacterium]
MKCSHWSVVAGVLFLAAGACGGEDDDADPTEVQQACSEYCAAAQVADCMLYDSESACVATECSGFERASKACLAALKEYYECLVDQANVCDTGCSLDIAACS